MSIMFWFVVVGLPLMAVSAVVMWAFEGVTWRKDNR